MAPKIDERTGRPIVTGYHKHPSACSYNQECQVCTDNFIDAGKKTGGRDAIIKVGEFEARAIIRDHVASINRDYNALNAIIAANGDKILARWKHSAKRRETVIREAFSDLPTEKWGHLYAYMDHGSGVPSATDPKLFRQRFLLPYMTQEAFLQDQSRLMQLLFLRSQHRPPQWAWTDHQLTRFGRHSGMLETRFSDAIFSTSLLLNNYGNHEKFDTHKWHAWQQVGFPVAEILFEAQRDLYKILRTAVDLILKGAEESATTNKTWLGQGAQGFKQLLPKDHNGTCIHVPVQPFEAPPRFDLTTMRELVAERQSAVEAEICLLQTDLVSAIQSVNAIQKGAHFQGLTSAEKWPRIAFELTQPLLSRARFWSPFSEYMDMIEVAIGMPESPYESRERVRQGRKLPLHIDLTLATTYELFSRYLKEDFPQILRNIASVDPYFDNAVATASRLPMYEEWDITRANVIFDKWRARLHNNDGRQCFDADSILWILLELASIERVDYSILGGAFTILEDILLAPKSYCQVDLNRLEQTRIIDTFADFATGLSIQSMLEAHSPKFRPVTRQEALDFHYSAAGRVIFDAIQRKRNTDGTQEHLYRSSSRRCWNWEQEHVPKIFAKAGRLLNKFYDVAPSPQPRATRPWWSKALEAKSALDDFWAAIRELEIQSLLKNPEPEYLHLTRAVVEKWKDVRVLDFYKETNFVDGVKAALDRDQAKTTQAAHKRKIDEENEHRRQIEAVFDATLASPTKKPKVKDDRKPSKRKDLPTCPGPETPAPIAQPPTPPSPDKIPASSTSMDILARMWPNDSGTLDISSARFSEVLAMMADIGYQGTPAGGSRWRFSGADGMIVVHAPHGNQATEVVRGKLLHYGRQLTERYGWGYGRFVERS